MNATTAVAVDGKPKLLDRVRNALRVRHLARSTEKTCDFDRLQITIRDAKGQKDRVTILPKTIVKPLRGHLMDVKRLHEQASCGSVTPVARQPVLPASVQV